MKKTKAQLSAVDKQDKAFLKSLKINIPGTLKRLVKKYIFFVLLWSVIFYIQYSPQLGEKDYKTKEPITTDRLARIAFLVDDYPGMGYRDSPLYRSIWVVVLHELWRYARENV